MIATASLGRRFRLKSYADVGPISDLKRLSTPGRPGSGVVHVVWRV